MAGGTLGHTVREEMDIQRGRKQAERMGLGPIRKSTCDGAKTTFLSVSERLQCWFALTVTSCDLVFY